MAAEVAAPGRRGNGGLAVDVAAASSGVAGLGGAVLFVALIAVVVLWCVPLIIAGLWNLPRKGAIAVLSLALGWTGVAWLAALVIVVAGAIRAKEPPLGPGPHWDAGGAQRQPPLSLPPRRPQYDPDPQYFPGPQPRHSGPPRGAHAGPGS
jgi:hypothetical protein